jgi:hypothetical protein
MRKFKVLVWFVVFQKNKNKSFNSRCKAMKIELLSKGVGARENGPMF